MSGSRAVHLSDLHMDRYLPRHDAVLDVVARLEPQWIFITGDLVDHPTGLEPLRRFLAGLRETAPVYMTLGNHDHASGVPVPRFAALAEQCDVHLLVNSTTIIPLSSGDLAITGLDDPSTHRADVRCIPPGAATRFGLVLAHAPNLVDLLDHRHGVDLILCGHSHGGQWRVPGLFPFWLPPGCRGRVGGEYWRNGRRLYVNRGLGWSLLPIRINCPPEILTVDWVAEESPAEAVAECFDSRVE